jgi:beta-lactam-binding protein with PASTA domain
MLKILALVVVVAAPIVQVPDVVGLSYEQAKQRLDAVGLQVGNVEPGHCPRPIGVVCRQNPQAGRKVDITEPVRHRPSTVLVRTFARKSPKPPASA